MANRRTWREGVKQSVRLLGTAAAALMIAAPASAAGPQSDDFDRFNLDLQRWTIVDPIGDGVIRMVGANTGDASLELSIPDGPSHDPWNTNRAFRVMQSADDVDFELTLLFKSEPTQQYQMQGLFIEQDADNWIRFDVLHDGARLRLFGATTVNGASSRLFAKKVDAGDGGGLRITRAGDAWSFAYLDAASGWKTASTAIHPIAVSSVGPYVANHPEGAVNAPAFTAIIDAFLSSTSPLIGEDDGAPADTDAPLQQGITASSVGPDEMEISWVTDEPAIGEVRIGLTTGYELGSFADASSAHSHAVRVSGLTPGETYHFQARSSDNVGNEAVSQDFAVVFQSGEVVPPPDEEPPPEDPPAEDPPADGPTIDVWYGLAQSFGDIGQPQPWVNILGNVSSATDVVQTLMYELNGDGVAIPITIGGDGKRLARPGDFNIDLASADLNAGANSVVITATDRTGAFTVSTVTVNYTPQTQWPLPTTVDWSSLTSNAEIQSVTQIVDGKWGLEQVGSRTFVRTLEPGYDRFLSLGDAVWRDYEFEVPVILHTFPAGFGVGVIAGWDGHTDDPFAGWQPKTGFLPLGQLLWARPSNIEILDDQANTLIAQPRVLSTGVVYIFKGRIETIPGAGTQVSFKVWEEGQPEPAAWDIADQDPLAPIQTGSIALLAHRADASFGPITVAPVEVEADSTPPVIANVDASASDTSALITWTTDEPADSLVEFGLTDQYGNQSSSATFTTSHSVLLESLTPETTYHYRAVSADGAGNFTETADMQFTTTAESEPPPPPPPTGGGAVQGDEFDAALDASVWTFVNAPDGAGSLVMTGSQAAISVAGPDEHEVWKDGVLAPRIVQAVGNGDFHVEIKIDSAVTDRFQDQGFVVEQDADNYLRFGFYSNGSRTNIFAAALHNGAPAIAINTRVKLTPPYFMRVERAGATWTQSYSDDGATWQTGGVFSNEPLTVSSIGLYAGNAQSGSAPDHTAVFDYIREVGGASLNLAESTAVPACAADLTADGVVDARDLSIALLSLGQTESAADRNGNGEVDGADVAIMLDEWGDCP